MNLNKISNIIQDINKLSLLEINTLIKNIKMEYNISDIIPENLSNNTSIDKNLSTEEKMQALSLYITEIPYEKKISVLKSVRTITGLGLKESKELVEKLPSLIKSNLNSDESVQLSKILEDAGAKIMLK